jgi:hypothetical protein
MKCLHKIMLNHGAYLEQVPLPTLMLELSIAINACKQFKPRIDADSLHTLWSTKSFPGFRNRIQYLVRRKRGQWAAIIKKEFTKLFLPSVTVKSRPSKRMDLELELIDVDDEDDVYEDSNSLSREETFRIGLLFMTDRVRSPNGSNQLRLSSTARYSNEQRLYFKLTPCSPRDPAMDWTRSHLYLHMVVQVATKIELPLTSETGDDGLAKNVSGIPRAFEAFLMMCVSMRTIQHPLSLNHVDRGTSISFRCSLRTDLCRPSCVSWSRA